MWSPRSVVFLSVIATSLAAGSGAGAEERGGGSRRQVAERTAREAGRGATLLRLLEGKLAEVGAATRQAGDALATVEGLGRVPTASMAPTLIDTNLALDRGHGRSGRARAGHPADDVGPEARASNQAALSA